MKIGRTIYYDKLSGEYLADTGDREGELISESKLERDMEIYRTLRERNRESFDFIKLEHGQFAQDFSECDGFRINPQTKEIEFSYPDPNQSEQPPLYQEPLSEQIKQLKERQDATENALLDFLLGGM